MCKIKNTIKSPFFLLYPAYMVNGSPLKWTYYWEKIHLISFLLYTKKKIFLSTILSKSPNLFLMELIFRYEKIMLSRCESLKRFKVALLFSLYSGLVVGTSVKETPFTCSTCLLLYHTFFKTLIIFFAKILFPVLFKCSLSLARQDNFMLSFFTNKKFLLLQ